MRNRHYPKATESFSQEVCMNRSAQDAGEDEYPCRYPDDIIVSVNEFASPMRIRWYTAANRPGGAIVELAAHACLTLRSRRSQR